jgi:antitoxin protein of toxin-antitoxin system
MVGMGIFDKAKDALSEHSDHVDAGIERAGDLVDERTGGRYAEHVDTGQDLASERVRTYAADDPEPTPEQPV